MFCRNMISIIKYLGLSSVVILISLIGDQLLALNRTEVNSYLIPLSDTLIHGLIAYFSWLLIYVSKGQVFCQSMVLIESFICALTASAIDLDHVIAARSIDLKTISHLSSRPFLHNTSLTLFISLTIICLGLITQNWMFHTYGWIFLTASLTHHLLDALRHGFWFYPLHTKPVPFWMYVLLLTSLPIIFSLLMDIVAKQWLERLTDFHQIKYKTIDSTVEEV